MSQNNRRRFLVSLLGVIGLAGAGTASAKQNANDTSVGRGTVLSVSSDGEQGRLRSRNDEEREFHNPARIDIRVDDDVVFVRVETEEGKDVNIIKEKKG